jgi:hypothetical protein
MNKNLLISLLVSIGLIGCFYLLDKVPKDNGGNLMIFSFFLICCTYLFLFISILLLVLFILKKYFNVFWTVFIPIYIIVSTIAIIYTSIYNSVHAFLVSKYTMFDMVSFLITIVILLLHLRFSKK